MSKFKDNTKKWKLDIILKSGRKITFYTKTPDNFDSVINNFASGDPGTNIIFADMYNNTGFSLLRGEIAALHVTPVKNIFKKVNFVTVKF